MGGHQGGIRKGIRPVEVVPRPNSGDQPKAPRSESYDALVQTIDARDKLPTWTDFEALVLRHEQLAKERSGGVTTTTALWTNPKGKSNGPKAGRTGNQTECYYCRKKGNFKRDCRKLKADFAAGRVDKDGKSNLGSGSAEANTASTRKDSP